MEEQHDFAALLNSYYDQEQLQRGDIRQAEIVHIGKSEIIVDVGSKRDGIVPSADLERLDPRMLKNLRVGDEVAVYVLNPSDRDGNLIVSLNLGLQGEDWERANALLGSGDSVTCNVIGYNKGGLLVAFNRVEGFVPVSHMIDMPQSIAEEQRSALMEAMIGQVMELKVIEVNQSRRRLILSQREAKRESRALNKQSLLAKLKVGDIIPGRVTGIRDFGVFVDIGGADGLIHVSEMAWYRVGHPEDVVSLGDEINVYVLELDAEQQRIALSLRRTMPDPWTIVEAMYQVGQVVTGQVSNVVDFGAFVVLPGGIEGLLHLTEMADGTLAEPHSYLKRGDQVQVRITGIEAERKRIGFSQLPELASTGTEEAEDYFKQNIAAD